jgi:hypothetical protein
MRTINRRLGVWLLLGLIAVSSSFAQSGPPPLPTLPAGQILDVWEFQSSNWLSVFDDAPISFTNISLTADWAGNGLLMDSTNPAMLNYAVISPDGWTNITFANGTVSMWFSSDWNTSDGGPGNWGTLLEVGSWNTNLAAATGAWGLFLAPTGDQLFFSAQTNGYVTNYLSAAINWNAGDWHQLVVTYSATNTALYLEGALAATGPGITVLPLPEVLSNGFSIGSDGNATGLSQARGVYNSLLTFDYPLDATTISNNYAYDSQNVYPLPFSGSHTDITGPPPPPGGGGTNTNSSYASGPISDFTAYTTNDFYLQFLPLGTNAFNTNAALATFLVHATENDASNEPVYQLWFATNLTPPVIWAVQQTFLGTTNTNFTVLTVPLTNVSSMFFEAVNLGTDPSGGGLPAWYLVQNGLDPSALYTGTNQVSNMYLDPKGDGWPYSALFNSGMSATTFYAPPSPLGFRVSVNTNGTVNFSWSPAVNLPATGAGAVTGYTLNFDGTNYTVGANQTTFTISGNPDVTAYFANPVGNPLYGAQLQINYANTNSDNAYQLAFDQNDAVEAYVVPGPNSHLNLVVSGIPQNVAAIRLFVEDEIYYLNDGNDYPIAGGYSLTMKQNIDENPTNYSFDVPVNNFTNGVYVISNAQVPLYSFFRFTTCAVNLDGTLGPLTADRLYVYLIPALKNIPFLDGSACMEQNLSFLLQAATQQSAFNFTWQSDNGLVTDHTGSINYACAGFHEYTDPASDPYLGEENFDPGAYLNEFAPFDDNYAYRNFVYSSGTVNPDGSTATGVYDANTNVLFTGGGDDPGGYPNGTQIVLPYTATNFFSEYNLANAGSTNPPSSILSGWSYTYYPDQFGLEGIGMFEDDTFSPPHLVLASGQSNVFGLPYQNVLAAYANSNGVFTVNTIAAGSPLSKTSPHTYYFYPSVTAPDLATVGYYFGRPEVDVLPGNPAFDPTNTTPLMIATAGQPFYLSAWARQSILNGNPATCGYLEQYFDKAFLADANGFITTNQTGVLCEYGEFFPTEPGLVYFTTRANAYSAPGSNAVPVIGLFTDGNHDGVIDTHFSGPDFATPARPFRFWVNDDDDSGDTEGSDIPGDASGVPNGMDGHINGVRDLVDFFPVYVDIQSLLEAIPGGGWTNYQFMLSQADGAINYACTSLTTNQPLQYLTDTNVAASLSASNVIQITSGGVLLSQDFVRQIWLSGFDDNPTGLGMILCEGRTVTTSPLVLSVLDMNSNVIAQASLQLSISPVEQMFRHKNLIWATYPNMKDGPPDRLADSDVPNEPETNEKNFIFLHGYNVNSTQARGWFAETFKRMYWSGSHAKFYGVTWLGSDGQIGGQVTPNLQTNIVHAFDTAPQLNTFLNSLSGTNVLASHSLGNMAILSALNDYGNTNINTFFMIDAAVATEALDGSTGINTNMIHPDWVNYTNRLWASAWYQLFPTNDYRNTLTWNDRLENLQNTQVYNFYSSGEEVLRTFSGAPPSALEGAFEQVLIAEQGHLAAKALINLFWPDIPGLPVGCYSWAWQEKMKGLSSANWLLSSDHGGWQFNQGYGTNYFSGDGYVTNSLDPATAATLPDSMLKTNAFFQFSSSDFSADSALLGSGGSAYAQTNRNRIISDAIPAVTLPIGANQLTTLDQPNNPHNFDMNTTYENGWPLARIQTPETNSWHHSDMRVVAYIYTYLLFNKFVTLGNLK